MIKINIGCGWRNFGKDWVHIDGGNYDHLDSKDITKLDYEDNSVDIIYASHIVEYFDRDEVIDILGEWVRVLKPKGILRLAVPNFKEMANLYLNKNYPLETFLGPIYGKMEMGEEIIYHKTAYDFNSLKNLVEKLGMKNTKKYKWEETEHSSFDDHSQAYIPHMDKNNGKLISLNIECYK